MQIECSLLNGLSLKWLVFLQELFGLPFRTGSLLIIIFCVFYFVLLLRIVLSLCFSWAVFC